MAMAPRQGVAGREVVDDESKWLWAQTARFRLESVGALVADGAPMLAVVSDDADADTVVADPHSVDLDAFVPGSAGWEWDHEIGMRDSCVMCIVVRSSWFELFRDTAACDAASVHAVAVKPQTR